MRDLIKAEEILKQVKIYFVQGGLQMNKSKIHCIFFGFHQYISQQINININGNFIQSWHIVKSLGVYFDQRMTFDRHVDEV